MICKSCKTSKKSKDFIGSQTECFKCVYIKKTKSLPKWHPQNKCVICGQDVTGERSKYCGIDCEEEAGRLRARKRYYTLRNREVPAR